MKLLGLEKHLMKMGAVSDLREDWPEEDGHHEGGRRGGRAVPHRLGRRGRGRGHDGAGGHAQSRGPFENHTK